MPDYALDIHTRRGRAMGRDVYHFLTVASRVEPEFEMEGNKEIFEKYKALLESEDNEPKSPNAFDFNPWQY